MTLNNSILGIIGSGNIGAAIAKGLINADIMHPTRIWLADVRTKHLQGLGDKLGVNITADNRVVAQKSDILIVAVKPQIIHRVLQEISDIIDDGKLVISVAAGVSSQDLERILGKDVRVIRTMPNTPLLVQHGCTALAIGGHAEEEDLARARAIFDSVGKTYLVDESLMDAVTGLSGSGPSYVFLIIDALADAGVKVGLPRYLSLEMAAETVLGSVKLLIETRQHPGVLKDMVTSPGGTAITGLHTLEDGGLRTTIINAVEAATNRSEVLGKKFSST